MEMYNPAHPGAIVRDFMGDTMTVSAFAKHLGMTRANLSMLLNGRMGVSANVALKLSAAFPNQPPELWMALQNQYDLWHAKRRKRSSIKPIYPAEPLRKAA